MPIFIYNSFTRKKEEFIPLKPPQVNIYTCGVTVYDESHIGHARSLYIFDLIRKYLEYREYKVRFVRNITDIDDKIINRAKELKIDWQELVAKYVERYYEDLEALGIQKGDYEPRATENITDMIKHIEGLINKGFAYATDSGVYFNVRKFKDYGKLSGQGIDQMLTGCRIEPDETKHDPLDFALWKRSKPDEPSWESPWSPGRPGWHIECSVMSQKFLKTDTLDIHAGGRDLIFPHHENEIAQAEALTGKPFAKYWVHHGLLTINSQKMAKSLGNFITIKDALKSYHPDVLKLFFLQALYSSPIDYSEKKMEEVTEYYRSFVLLFREYRENLVKYGEGSLQEEKKKEIDREYREKFIQAMDDDFNTPVALSILNRAKSDAYSMVVNFSLKDNWGKFQYIIKMIEELLSSNFGIFTNNADVETDDRLLSAHARGLRKTVTQAWIEEMRKKIEQLRREKKYAQADEIKEELKAKGFEVLDKKDGTTEVR
ncbi:MAG: cysteine--tRNA ligase [Candidatus Omnitrophota bacterium]